MSTDHSVTSASIRVPQRCTRGSHRCSRQQQNLAHPASLRFSVCFRRIGKRKCAIDRPSPASDGVFRSGRPGIHPRHKPTHKELKDHLRGTSRAIPSDRSCCFVTGPDFSRAANPPTKNWKIMHAAQAAWTLKSGRSGRQERAAHSSR
jgi:hypothetical protein